MTDTEIKEITIMQRRGVGYAKIAAATGLPVNSVKSFIARHPAESGDVCLCCGVPLEQNEHKRRKTFCSAACKNKWWYRHPHMMTKQTMTAYECPVCGKPFKDYGKRVYCSVACYAEARRKKNG